MGEGGDGGTVGASLCDQVCVAKAWRNCSGFTHEACLQDCEQTALVAEATYCEAEYTALLECGVELDASGLVCLGGGEVDFNYAQGACAYEYYYFTVCFLDS
jgi:hypothetical protein